MSPHASTRRRHVVRIIWWTHVSTRFPLLPEQRLQQQGGDARLAEEGHDEVAVAIEAGGAADHVLDGVGAEGAHELVDLAVVAAGEKLPEPARHAQLGTELRLPAVLLALEEALVEPAGLKPLDQRIRGQRGGEQAV